MSCILTGNSMVGTSEKPNMFVSEVKVQRGSLWCVFGNSCQLKRRAGYGAKESEDIWNLLGSSMTDLHDVYPQMPLENEDFCFTDASWIAQGCLGYTGQKVLGERVLSLTQIAITQYSMSILFAQNTHTLLLSQVFQKIVWILNK